MAQAENLCWIRGKLAKLLVAHGTELKILKLKDSQTRCFMEDLLYLVMELQGKLGSKASKSRGKIPFIFVETYLRK